MSVNHQSQLQAGSLTYNGPRQIYRPKPIILATSTGLGKSFTTTVVIPVPSSQTRIKLSVFFANLNGGATAIPGSIWVSACEEDRSGTAQGKLFPVTDVEGTQASPTAFPADGGLFGYSRSFVTSADWLQAVITVNSVGEGLSGNWILQTSIQPDATTFVWEAWDQIRRAFVPSADGEGSI